MQDQSNINTAMSVSVEDIPKHHSVSIPEKQMSVTGAQIINQLSTPITITYHNLSKVIQVPAKMIDPDSKEKMISRTLIDNISGQIQSGQVVALMGPSGCGKTTLLNILSGRALHGVTGDVWINDQRYEKSMKHKFAYVLQEDIFFDALTVKQQLTYTALLRLPKTMTRKDKLAQVNDIIEQLRLGKCANTPIMLISGGEKRRTNIATELLTNPSVIFLDEPTSGLDSTSAVGLMNVLRELAMQGKTIITSIHQPSSQIFQSFDHLILLADGKTIFMGKPSNVIDYFGALGHQSPPQYNPADFMMDLVNQDTTIRDDLKDAYLKNRLTPLEYHLTPEPSGKEVDLPNNLDVNLSDDKRESKWAAGYLTQTSILFRRNLLLTFKAQFSRLNCIQALCLSIMCGLLWLRMGVNEKTLKDRSSLIFFLLIFWPLEISFAGILSFQNERSIIQKERASGSFQLSTYYLAKCLSETPLKIVLPTFSFTIVYWMGNMNSNFGIFIAMLIFILMVVLVAESLGLLFGALFGSIGRAWVAGNVILLGLLLVGGYFIENIPYWLSVWIKWISFYKYAYDATIRLEFMGDRVFKCVSGTVIKSCENNLNGTFTGKDALEVFRPDLGVGWNFLVLFGMFITFRLAVYLVLRFVKHNDGRI